MSGFVLTTLTTVSSSFPIIIDDEREEPLERDELLESGVTKIIKGFKLKNQLKKKKTKINLLVRMIVDSFSSFFMPSVHVIELEISSNLDIIKVKSEICKAI